MTNVIPFKAMKKSYSKKLDWFFRDFLKMEQIQYDEAECCEGKYTFYFELNKSGMCIKQTVEVKEDKYICFTELACKVNMKERKNYSTICMIINEINNELEDGYFVADAHGNIVFRNYYFVGREVYDDELADLMYYPHYIVNKFSGEIVEVITN